MNDVNLPIEQGRSIAFTEHNGCGKGTLLKITEGLVRLTDGTVCLEKGNRIHYVPKHFPKINLTMVRYLTYMEKLEKLNSSKLESQIHVWVGYDVTAGIYSKD